MSVVPADEEAGSVRELLRVAIPLVISWGSLSVMGVIDRILLTWVSVDTLAASMPAGMLHWTVLSLPFGIALYTNTFVAQYEGAGKKSQVAACVWQGMWLSLLAGGLILAATPVAVHVFGFTGHAPHIQVLERTYYSVLTFGSTPILASGVMSAFFNGRGRTDIVMWVNVGATVINAVLDVILIFGWGPIPAMGIAGAAWATVCANVVACLIFALLVYREGERNGYPILSQWRWNSEMVGRMFRFGLPNGVQSLVDIGAFFMFVLLSGRLGTIELAATNLAFNLNSMVFIPLFGLGTAVLTLVGRRIGEQRPDLAVRSTRLAFGLATAYIFVFGVLYVGMPKVLLAPYFRHASEVVVEVGATGEELVESGEQAAPPEDFDKLERRVVVLLRFVALYSFFDAMAVIFGSAVRGAGDVRFSLWLTGSCVWLLMAIPAWAVTQYTSWGLNGIWCCATLSIVVLGCCFWLRFEGGAWRSMRVIEESEPVVEEAAV